MDNLAFMQSRLWRSAFGFEAGVLSADDPRSRLSAAFLKFRERAAHVAAEIARDLPEFTVHDVTHLDALWQMADLIADEGMVLTPTEAFVLGGAFLIHDLGMGLAAYPGGKRELRSDPGWDDLVSAYLKRQLGRAPTSQERHDLPSEVEVEVIGELLRLRHAKQAEKLARISWSGRDGETYHLIEDVELRRAFGATIGQIGYSHWWSPDDLRQGFGGKHLLTPPAIMNFPADWTVDRLKIACLLRTADAIHLDSRRAPGFLRALRKPEGYADRHWIFQQNIHAPMISGDRILFTSGHPFNVEEAAAWWVGYELLQNADRELRQVDALVQDLETTFRFAARSVAGVESPSRLVHLIPVEDWTPIDARVRVTNVASLVRELGGEQLYGRDPTVPLRELIQNAADAVRARRLLKGLPEDWGEVTVKLGKDEKGHWLEVEDNGVGMSTAVLAGPFLDFGNSFWGTPMVRDEWPGLQGKGFESTGQYGIGFFSVFMWGKRALVTTNRCGEAARDTQVIEFSGGLEERPLLRRAVPGEYVDGGGTRVRVWFDEAPDSGLGLLNAARAGGGTWTLEDLCAWLCPCLDVNLDVQVEGEARTRAVSASDWKSLDARALINRIFLDSHHEEVRSPWREGTVAVLNNLRSLRDPSGKETGRATICSEIFDTREASGVIVAPGGLRNGSVRFIAGVLFGNSVRASRESAVPLVDSLELARWATEQAALLDAVSYDDETMEKMAAIIRSCGGQTAGLPICRGTHGSMSASAVAAWAPDYREILVVSRNRLGKDGSRLPDDWVPNENVLITRSSRPTLIEGRHVAGIFWPEHRLVGAGGRFHDFDCLETAVIESIANGWGCSLNDVLSSSTFFMTQLDKGEIRTDLLIGRRADGSELALAPDVIIRPSL